MKLSVIVPALNEAHGIVEHLTALQCLRQRGHEVIVVDGGSHDETVLLSESRADWVITAARGRAQQMNAGAARATGDTLLFLHADTRLPEGADRLIERALMGSGRLWGRFDVSIDGPHFMLPVVAAMMNARSRVTGIATGDQAMFVTRAVFERVGGFPNLALMEDIELSALLKSESKPACLRAKVTTSGRRWLRHGVFTTVFFMWRLRLRFALGASAQRLAREYPSHER